MVGDTVLVSNDGASSPGFLSSTSSKCFDTTVEQGITTSLVSENETAGSSFIGEAFRYTELPSEVTKVILESWRPSTRSRYEPVLKRWHRYAISSNEDPYSPDVNTVLTFMHGMYLSGCLYSGLCAACSALSSVVTFRGYLKLSEHPLVSRYLKGIYNRHPPLPKYVNMWDIWLLLRYFDTMDSNDNLQFKVLAIKTVMLFIIWGHVRNRLYLHEVLTTSFSKKIKSFCFPI